MSDLVVISLEPWDDVWRRNQYLIDGLIRIDPGRRVLFVEPHADPLHDASSRRRPRFGHGRRPVPGYEGRLFSWQQTKWLPRRIDRGFDARLASAVAREARRMGLTRPVLWINDPRTADVMTATGWPALYDITDDWAVADRPDEERARIIAGEDLLLAEAAEVVVCSAELERRKSPLRAASKHPIVVIPNAVDVAEYQRPRSRPPVLPAGRTAVYAGTLHEDRLDVDLVVASAAALAGEMTIVLVGPNALGRESTERLRGAGVHLLGAQPRDTLIGCLQHADVLIVPHLVNAFTDSLDPIKLYEYLAVGRPIVSTAVAGFLGQPHVTLAELPAFAACIRAPRVRTSEETTVIADWSLRTRQICEVIAHLQSASSGG